MAKQVTVKTQEFGRVYGQLEDWQEEPHLVLQPLAGGPASRYPLDGEEAKAFFEDYPELRRLLRAEKDEGKSKAKSEAKS